MLDRRDRAEQEARGHRRRDRERERARIDGDLVQARQRARAECDEGFEPDEGKQQTERASGGAEHEALDEQLPRDPAGPCPERRADRELVTPRVAAHEREVRDVRARDQQYAADRAQQRPEHRRDVADDVRLQRLQGRREAVVRDSLARHLSRRSRPCVEPNRQHAFDVGARFLQRHAGSEPRDTPKVEAAVSELAAVETQRRDQLDLGRDVDKAESRGHDADDLRRAAIHRHDAADDRFVAAELPLPIGIGEDRRIGAVGLRRGFGFREQTAERRLNADRLEHAVRNSERAGLLRIADTRHAAAAGPPDPEVLERAVLVAVGEVHRRRHGEPLGVDSGRPVPEAHELVGIRIGQRLDQHRVDDAEDRRRCADAEREREHGGRGERGPAVQPAQRPPEVAAEGVEKAVQRHHSLR